MGIGSPAANDGIFGLRPQAAAFRNQVAQPHSLVLGTSRVLLDPLSISLDGITLFMRTVLDAEPWIPDPSVVPLPRRFQSILVKMN